MKKLKKRYIVIIVVILISIFSYTFYKIYNYLRVKNAKIEVELIDDLDLTVYSDVHVKNLIKSINGKIISNKKIDTNTLGKKEVVISVINDDNIITIVKKKRIQIV